MEFKNPEGRGDTFLPGNTRLSEDEKKEIIEKIKKDRENRQNNQ